MKATSPRALLCLILFCSLVVPAPLGAATDGPRDKSVSVAPNLKVKEVVFGHVDEQTGKIVESRRIDTSKHPGFAWELKFEGMRRTVRFKEEFILPAPAQTWQVGRETTVATDRASAVTEGDRRLERDMKLRNGWVHTEGDPKGRHTMRIWVNGVLVREIDFTLY